MWEKISQFLGHIAGRRQQGAGTRPHDEFYNFNEFVPPGTNQRRSHLRLDLFLPLNFRRLAKRQGGPELDDEAVLRGDFDRIQTGGGMGLNLSGSGVLIIASEKIEKNDYIEICDRLFGKQMTIVGKVTRSVNTDFDNSRVCEFGVNFIRISDPDREFIVRAIFDKIKSLKKLNFPESF